MHHPSLNRFYRWFLPLLGAGAIVTWLTAGALPEPPVKTVPDDADKEERHPVMRSRIREVTGVRTKVVWVRDLTGGRDPFTQGRKLSLMGVDTDDPRGVRQLAGKRRNYSRPLITPDGSAVVYTNRDGKNGESDDGKRNPKRRPAIYIVDWETGKERKLRAGFALDLWQDPADGRVWVFALSRLNSGNGPNTNGRGIFRFRLDDPKVEKSVWDKGTVTADNFQVNRGGTAASGLLPWPNAGRLEFANKQFVRHTNGCWPSMAPDNSGLSWVFDGAHENLRMYLPGLEEPWKVNISAAEGIGGREVYHPRWSNHPSFVIFTGPYQAQVHTGGKGVEVVIGRFNEDLTALGATVMLKDRDRNPDFFPDLWLEGGESVSLNPAALGPMELRERKPVEPAPSWQVEPDGLLFQWENALASNTAPTADGTRVCSVEPRKFARFDRNFAMITDGGWFEADAESAASAAEKLAAGPWSVEFAATLPAPPAGSGVILAAGTELVIRQAGPDITISRRDRVWRAAGVLPATGTIHFAAGARSASDSPFVLINGTEQPVEEVTSPGPVTTAGALTFGGLPGGREPWGGTLEAVAIHAVPPASGRAAAHAGWWANHRGTRKAPEQTVVRAELVECSPVQSVRDIAPYLRAWTTCNYRRLEVLSGPDPGPEFTVTHWTILDRELIPGALPSPGSTRVLVLEPLADHRELESERGSDEVSTDELPGFFDVSTPGKRNSEVDRP